MASNSGGGISTAYTVTITDEFYTIFQDWYDNNKTPSNVTITYKTSAMLQTQTKELIPNGTGGIANVYARWQDTQNAGVYFYVNTVEKDAYVEVPMGDEADDSISVKIEMNNISYTDAFRDAVVKVIQDQQW